MPGLMTLRREYAEVFRLRGARISGSLPHDRQTGVLIETSSVSVLRPVGIVQHLLQPGSAAAAVVVGPHGSAEEPRGVPCFAWKARRWRSTGGCTEQMMTWPTSRAELIMDDGGEATMLVHKGTTFEKAGVCPPRTKTTRMSGRCPGGIAGPRWPLRQQVDGDLATASAGRPKRPPRCAPGCISWPAAGELLFRRSTSTIR